MESIKVVTLINTTKINYIYIIIINIKPNKKTEELLISNMSKITNIYARKNDDGSSCNQEVQRLDPQQPRHDLHH